MSTPQLLRPVAPSAVSAARHTGQDSPARHQHPLMAVGRAGWRWALLAVEVVLLALTVAAAVYTQILQVVPLVLVIAAIGIAALAIPAPRATADTRMPLR